MHDCSTRTQIVDYLSVVFESLVAEMRVVLLFSSDSFSFRCEIKDGHFALLLLLLYILSSLCYDDPFAAKEGKRKSKNETNSKKNERMCSLFFVKNRSSAGKEKEKKRSTSSHCKLVCFAPFLPAFSFFTLTLNVPALEVNEG